MKTNQEIMQELKERGRFKTPEEVEKFFLRSLEAKDAEAVLAVEIVSRNLNEAHKQEREKDNPIPPEIIVTCLNALYYVQSHVENRPEIQKAIKYLTQTKA